MYSGRHLGQKEGSGQMHHRQFSVVTYSANSCLMSLSLLPSENLSGPLNPLKITLTGNRGTGGSRGIRLRNLNSNSDYSTHGHPDVLPGASHVHLESGSQLSADSISTVIGPQ